MTATAPTNTAVKLTPAAKRYLTLIQDGGHPELTYGPYSQLVSAGYITGPQDGYRVT